MPFFIDSPTQPRLDVVARHDHALRADAGGPVLYYVWPLRIEISPISVNIVLEYDEPVIAGAGRIVIRDEGGRIVLQEPAANSARITIAGNKVTIDPAADFTYSTTFQIEIEAGFVKDADGHASVAAKSIFTTLNNPLPLKLTGTAGADDMRGGDANDYLRGEAGDDKLQGYGGDDVLDGGDGDDTIVNTEGRDILFGGNGNDTLLAGSPLLEQLTGGAGDDFLKGGDGNDIFDAGSGNDTIEVIAWAPPGATVKLSAGTGNDLIRAHLAPGMRINASGGDGVDTFAVKAAGSGAGVLAISDFVTGAGGDLIDMSALMPPDLGASNPFGTLRYLRLVQVGSNTVLQFDADGTSTAHTWQDVVNLANTDKTSLTANNFVKDYDPAGVDDGRVIVGSEKGDVIGGLASNDTLRGLGGNDRLYGGLGNDLLDGGEGDDLLIGGTGSNVLAGGNGLDTASYDVLLGQASIVSDAGKWLVRDTAVTGGSPRFDDILSGVERLSFKNTSWALDIDGTAGKVYRIYQAAFDRTPDPVGLGFWIKQVDGGLSLSNVTSGFVQSAEFAALYGAGPANSELIARFYQNVLHRKPDPLGEAYWIRVLDEQKASVAEVLAQFSESPENQEAVARIIGNGFMYQEYA